MKSVAYFCNTEVEYNPRKLQKKDDMDVVDTLFDQLYSKVQVTIPFIVSWEVSRYRHRDMHFPLNYTSSMLHFRYFKAYIK